MATEINPLDSLNLTFDTTGDNVPVSAADIAAAGQHTSQQKSKVTQQAINTRQQIGNKVSELERINDDIISNAVVKEGIQKKASKLKLDTTKAAAAGAEDAIGFYDKSVNGTAANKHRDYLLGRLDTARNELQVAQSQVDGSTNIFGRAVAQISLNKATKKMQLAQNSLEQFQRTNANSVRAMGNAALASQTAAANGSAATAAEIQMALENTTAHITTLRTKGNATKDEIATLGATLGFDNQIAAALDSELKTLIDTNRAYSSAIEAEFRKAQMNQYENTVAESKLDNNALIEMQDEYFKRIGRTDLVGKFTDATTLQKSLPDVAYGFQRDVVLKTSQDSAPYSFLVSKSANPNQAMNPVDNNRLLFIRSTVQAHNEALVNGALVGEGKTPATASPLDIENARKKVKLLNIDDPKDYPEIDRVSAIAFSQLNVDATPALRSGRLVIPDSSVVMEQIPTVTDTMKKGLPPSAYETFIKDAYKDVNWSIDNRDPSGSIDGIVSVLGERMFMMDKEKSGSAEGDIRNISLAAAKYYQTVLEQISKNEGFHNLSTIRIEGVSIRQPDINGTDSLGTGTRAFDMTMPTEWEQMIRTELIKRKSEAAQHPRLGEIMGRSRTSR